MPYTRGLLILCSALFLSIESRAADFDLKFAHFWPTRAPLHQKIFQPWADTIEKQSRGRIEFTMYPAQELIKAPDMYPAAAEGRADVTVAVLGYTPNRFPLTQIIELPSLVNTAVGGSCILQNLYDEDLISAEFDDTRLLFLFTHGPGHIHTKDKPINRPEDLNGLSIRRPTMVIQRMLENVGAKPMAMPAPRIYDAAVKNDISGATLPWEAMYSFKLNEHFRYHTEISLYTLGFAMLMAKNTYSRLPPDLQNIIDNNSGALWSELAGTVFDQADLLGIKGAEENQHQIVTVEDGAAHPVWGVLLSKISQTYIWELALQDMPSAAIYNRILRLADTVCEQES